MRPRQLWTNLRVAATESRARRGAPLAAGIGILILGVAAAAGGLRISRYVVRGPSMAPTLADGDRVLVLRGVQRFVTPRTGQLVLARPRALADREVVKRVAAVERGDHGPRFVLLGDNAAASTDSRHFGPVSRREITGLVWLRYWPEERRGRTPGVGG